MQITGSILQPNISGMIKLSHGEAYLPHDKGNGTVVNRLASNVSSFPPAGYNRMTASSPVSRFFGSLSPSTHNKWPQPSGILCELSVAWMYGCFRLCFFDNKSGDKYIWNFLFSCIM